MSSQEKLAFPSTIRQLRVSRRLRQKDVAEAIKMNEGSYANAESNNHKTMRLDKVFRLAEFHELDATARDALVAAWQALPASKFNERNRPAWERRNATRSKAKAHDAMKLSLLEMLSLYIGVEPNPCTCPPVDPFTEPPEPCEICKALQLLGLSGWGPVDLVTAKLAEIQDEMTKKPEGDK